MADPTPIRMSALKRFLKSRTGLRVGDATAEAFATVAHAAFERAALLAKERAESESRRTLLSRDLEGALAPVTIRGDGTAPTPEAVRTVLRELSNADLSRLVRLLRDELAALAEPD